MARQNVERISHDIWISQSPYMGGCVLRSMAIIDSSCFCAPYCRWMNIFLLSILQAIIIGKCSSLSTKNNNTCKKLCPLLFLVRALSPRGKCKVPPPFQYLQSDPVLLNVAKLAIGVDYKWMCEIEYAFINIQLISWSRPCCLCSSNGAKLVPSCHSIQSQR